MGRVPLLTDMRPLRESADFRRLWAATIVSGAGSSMTMFAVTLQVYDLTHDPFAVGLVGLARMVPTLGIGLLGGALADATDRRKLALVTTSCLAAASAAFAAQAYAGLSLVWLLYLLVALDAAVAAVDSPAKRTFLPRLLPASQIPAGLALNRVTFQVMLIVGPALAGLITDLTGGVQACYLIDAVSFAATLYAVARLPSMKPGKPGDAARPGLRAVGAGISFIRRSQVLAGAFLADLNATVLGLPASLFPAINADHFGGSPTTLGLFTAAVGVGGLVSSVLAGPVGHIERQGLAMLGTVTVWGAAFAGFAVARVLWLALALLALAGAADTFTVVFRSAILQQVTPDELLGRVMAADYVVGAGGGDLGNAEAGALGSLTSPTISAFAGGIATMAGSLLIGLALPVFRRYRYVPPPPEPPGTPSAGERAKMEQ
jgi:MFS family permease